MRKLFLFIFLLCSVAKGMAQQEEGTFRIEPHVGTSITNLTHADMNATVGGILGLNAQCQFSERFGVVTGVDYVNYGAKHDHVKLTLGYIEVPMLAKYYVYKGLSVYTGAEFGYNVCDGRTDILLLSEANKFAAGIPVGMTYDFKHFSINAQYYLGLTKVYKDFDYRSRGVRITLGYKI